MPVETTTDAMRSPQMLTPGPGQRPLTSRYRWVICGLLFAATTINYVDRSVLNVIEPVLKTRIGWSAVEYGYINAAFNAAYAIGFIFVGWFIDLVGVRAGYALSLIVWSLAAAGHALANGVWGFGVARFCLGIGESGNFPAAIKTVAEWFPKRERALSTGIFNAGANVGAFLAPVIVPFMLITLKLSWHWVFVGTGIAGMIWVFFWWPMYRSPEAHPRVSQAELDYIHSEPMERRRRVRWLRLIPHRQTWAFSVGKFLTDPVWWFYLFWSGKFINERFHVDIKHLGPPLIIIYVLADVGSVLGGWLSSSLLKQGWTANAARKTAMLVCALCILPVIYAPITHSEWVAVVLIGIAAAAHQGFSANIFTTTSDMFPRWAVASVVGFGGMWGAIGGILINIAAGWVKDLTGSFLIMFIIAGCVYLLALLLFHVLAPRLEPAQLVMPEGEG